MPLKFGVQLLLTRKLFEENSFKHALEAPYIEKLNVKLQICAGRKS